MIQDYSVLVGSLRPMTGAPHEPVRSGTIKAYQLALRTPGSSPRLASSRTHTRHRPN